ncbi:CTP synthase (glutamine hydrolyzing) [Sarracenia purpurea var. burkii]
MYNRLKGLSPVRAKPKSGNQISKGSVMVPRATTPVSNETMNGVTSVLEKERRGDYLGKTLQIVTHITDAIKNWIEMVSVIPVDEKEGPTDVCVIDHRIGWDCWPFEGEACLTAEQTPGREFLLCVSHLEIYNESPFLSVHEQLSKSINKVLPVLLENVEFFLVDSLSLRSQENPRDKSATTFRNMNLVKAVGHLLTNAEILTPKC